MRAGQGARDFACRGVGRPAARRRLRQVEGRCQGQCAGRKAGGEAYPARGSAEGNHRISERCSRQDRERKTAVCRPVRLPQCPTLPGSERAGARDPQTARGGRQNPRRYAFPAGTAGGIASAIKPRSTTSEISLFGRHASSRTGSASSNSSARCRRRSTSVCSRSAERFSRKSNNRWQNEIGLGRDDGSSRARDKRPERCEPGPILLCMGLFSRFCVRL